ncbi:DNA-directed RNA polymerase subunit A [Halogranum amylolyticum]|uniref:DNA-directed RNA polymerase subunit Rpo1C n=1 Tax=Halogranum amylolyticum TaxID=660520 RepID=A0A1H8QB89_9EURY|nr:DNA-directed RNA polymerase subunit A'' [Halogranum amylolyticum]SEO51278.1 DNA-directed RNA polymerase subunit A [Halogranum amylolyticum]
MTDEEKSVNQLVGEYDHVTEDIALVVEDTELPRRLKTRVYKTIESREGLVTPEQANEIAEAVENRYIDTRVDPLDPVGTVSAQSIGEPGTQMTMNTFHYAGVAEIDVTQGLPRLIELVDARKTPDTPMMTVHLESAEQNEADVPYATDRERAHEVVWDIEATKILALGDVSTNVADMLVQIDLNDDTLAERWPRANDVTEVAQEIAETIEDALGVKTRRSGTVIEFGPDQPSYRQLLQLVEQLREITFKGIEEISRVVIRKEQTDEGDEEFVLYTEGSAFGDVLSIEGVDASRTTCNNIHEVYRELGVEAAREAIIEETMDTLREQGLDDVNIRHLMLVADIMTNRGTIESIGRHGISGSKDSVLARAAFEVTVNHLLDAAIHGENDDLDGVIENVIVGKPVAIGTGDVDLKMGSFSATSDD